VIDPKFGRPSPGRSRRSRNDQGRAAPRLHGQVDTMGVRSLRDTWCRSDHERPVGAPSPTRAARASHPSGCTGRGHPARVDPSPCRRGRVGRTTEPRGCAGGRPRRRGTPAPDETVTAGCPRNYPVVPFLYRRVTTGQWPRSLPDVLVRRSGRQDADLATGPHRRSFSNRPTDQPQRTARPLAFRWRLQACAIRAAERISDRPTRGPPKPRQPHQLAPTRATTDETRDAVPITGRGGRAARARGSARSCPPAAASRGGRSRPVPC
jgi:hypothetical protein